MDDTTREEQETTNTSPEPTPSEAAQTDAEPADETPDAAPDAATEETTPAPDDEAPAPVAGGLSLSSHQNGRLNGHVLMTGYPGFLAAQLLRRLMRQHEGASFIFVVESLMYARAEARLRQLEVELPEFAGRWSVAEGDITRQRLGLSPELYDELTQVVEVVWHLAAIYNLSVPESVAYEVNVRGTFHVLDFCEDCANLARLNYVSTCYVSGDRVGKIYEDELDRGQHYKNHYEETKFWAEVEVQRRSERLPVVIYRPGIVVGDSTTGAIPKYDGPYYLFGMLRKMPSWAPMFTFGKGDAVVNLVPIDFVVKALTHIAQQPEHEGRIFQIADPQPMRARDILASALTLMGRKPAVGNIPPALAERALELKAVEDLTGVPREALIYFNHDARYDSTNTQRALQETDIRCPHLSTYLDRLIDYFERHPLSHG